MLCRGTKLLKIFFNNLLYLKIAVYGCSHPEHVNTLSDLNKPFYKLVGGTAERL
jgi:hypothetical protein